MFQVQEVGQGARLGELVKEAGLFEVRAVLVLVGFHRHLPGRVGVGLVGQLGHGGGDVLDVLGGLLGEGVHGISLLR